jgi:hypothetical protein
VKGVPNSQQVKRDGIPNKLVAISAGALYTSNLGYDWLREINPDKKIGYSIFIYDFRDKKTD